MKAPCVLALSLLLALLVGATAAGSHGGLHPSQLDLVVSDGRVGGEMVLRATLLDDAGNPLPGEPIVFELETTFGWLELGRRFTNADGQATLEYVPSGAGPLTFRARFLGGTGVTTVGPSGDVATAIVTERPLESPLPVAAGIAVVVAAVVGSIWAAYAFVLLELRAIRTDGGGPEGRSRREARAR